MSKEAFLKHDVEIGFSVLGKTSKQTIPNLKETVASSKMVELGQLFVDLSPAEVIIEDVVTVKRTRHQRS